MEYIKAANIQDFAGTAKKLINVNDKKILILHIDSEYFAVDNKCTHMGGSLYEGKTEGHIVVCPRHGSGFDVRTGVLARQGKLAFLKVKPANIRTYTVRTDGNDIFIGIE